MNVITEVIAKVPTKRPKRISATFVNTVNVPGHTEPNTADVKPASTGGFSKS